MTRYYVSSITGQAGTSYSVLDRYTCHREVATFYAPEANVPYGLERRQAQVVAECARLNALDAAA